MRRPRPYNPDPDTLRLLDEFRDVSAASHAHARALVDARQRRAELVRRLLAKGLTYRHIAKEVGLSYSGIQRLTSGDASDVQ